MAACRGRGNNINSKIMWTNGLNFEINLDEGEDLTNSFIYRLKSNLRLIQMKGRT